uniref:Uncharacterized protein n=1 Tax=Oryza punctata TaxID=4537 RepID=A0A0E0KDX8_ORYPU
MRLPPFLVKPQHTYVVRVGRTCKITYRCGGPLAVVAAAGEANANYLWLITKFGLASRLGI